MGLDDFYMQWLENKVFNLQSDIQEGHTICVKRHFFFFFWEIPSTNVHVSESDFFLIARLQQHFNLV